MNPISAPSMARLWIQPQQVTLPQAKPGALPLAKGRKIANAKLTQSELAHAHLSHPSPRERPANPSYA